jgi:hypothetical protein
MMHLARAALLLLLPGLAQALPGPRSPAIFPEQEIALRFSHAQHLRKGVKCAQCHNQIARSELASDRNIPGQGRCEACHEIEEAKAGKKVDPPSACQDCHPGFDWTVHRAPRPSRFPAPHLTFSHARHLDRGAQCSDCHGDMVAVDLATRDQLPRMATCLGCHDGARAPSACATCHVGTSGAKGAPLQTRFPSGVLRPGPENPLGLDHGPRFERAHAQLAARQRDQCMACHTESSCMKCHDGATRPQAVHPGDFISTHMVAARQDDPRCDSCHRRQSFCVACHERTGVGFDAKPAFRDPTAKVHPSGWLTPGPQHHGVQAARNIGACASCHREETCVGCHATGGVRPHPPGFASRCAEMLRKNDRACAKCHDLATLAGQCR